VSFNKTPGPFGIHFYHSGSSAGGRPPRVFFKELDELIKTLFSTQVNQNPVFNPLYFFSAGNPGY